MARELETEEANHQLGAPIQTGLPASHVVCFAEAEVQPETSPLPPQGASGSVPFSSSITTTLEGLYLPI